MPPGLHQGLSSGIDIRLQAILAKSRPASTRILVLNERSETAEFRDLFADWHGVKGGPEGGASTKLKGECPPPPSLPNRPPLAL